MPILNPIGNFIDIVAPGTITSNPTLFPTPPHRANTASHHQHHDEYIPNHNPDYSPRGERQFLAGTC
ncbi:hypothetical protein BDW66DRAFT_144033 [Aspergillus desertorum]